MHCLFMIYLLIICIIVYFLQFLPILIVFSYIFDCIIIQMTSYTTSYIKPSRQSDQPLDSVQTILWDIYDRSCRTFFTCGWDGLVKYFQIEGNSSKVLQKKWEFYFYHPIISIDVTRDKILIAGLATGQIGVVQMDNTNNCMILGNHSAPICKIVWIEKYEVVVSFGFDNLIKVFTLKNQQNNNFQIGEYKLPFKTSTVAFSFPYFLVGAQNGSIALLHSQKFNDIAFDKQYQNIFDESHGLVKFTASAINMEKSKIVLGTADGRLITTNFVQSHNGIRISKPVVSKLQKKKNYRNQTVGQMNCVDFGLKQNKYEFVIFGGTVQMGLYNIEKSSKIKSLGSSQTTVTAISLSPDCQHYAFAYGTDWNQGIDSLNLQLPVRINVGRISTSDVSSSSYSYMR